MKFSDTKEVKMDLLDVPSMKNVKIQPMDALRFVPNPDRYDDDDEIGLGYQKTLVSHVFLPQRISFLLHFIAYWRQHSSCSLVYSTCVYVHLFSE